MSITVLSADEYEAQEFDAVLVRDNAVVCLDVEEELLRMIPLEKVNHIDADPETMLTGQDIPETFHGGGECGFVEVEKFPDLEQHLEEISRETL